MDDVARAADLLRGRLPAPPRVLLVLGSGLGALAEEIEAAVRIPFEEVPGFPPPRVVGHAGRLVGGRLEGVDCLALQGRFHLYEGHTAAQAALPVRVAAALGAEVLLVTNAAGGINADFSPGDLMIIDDHLNLMGQNPLVGAVREGEERFPDMSQPYDAELRALALKVAGGSGIPMVRGVYAAVLGPSYETAAEVRMLQRLGADAVGMSTVPEVVAARALGVRVLGISLITNPAAGLLPTPLDHAEVVAAGREAGSRFSALVRGVLGALPPD